MKAIHYDNGRRIASEKVNAIAELMAKYPQFEVNLCDAGALATSKTIAILTDWRSTSYQIRVYA